MQRRSTLARTVVCSRWLGLLVAFGGWGCAARDQAAPAPRASTENVVLGALAEDDWVAEDEWIEVAAEGDEPRAASEDPTFLLGAVGSSPARPLSSSERAREGAYELDGVSRFLSRSDPRRSCSGHDLLSYPGTQIRFGGTTVVNAAFRERLERFEDVVSDVALATYGRRPLLIRHRGAFACRSRRGQPSWLSEHALGNAIDVSGFEFGPASTSDEAAPPGTPLTAFGVSVARDWRPEGGASADQRRARFLHSLVARLVARGDVFRGIITPADSAHANHFHFDMAQRSHARL